MIKQEQLMEFLQTEDGKALLQPRLDKYFQKGLDTWVSNNIQRTIEEALNPVDPHEQKISELQKQLEIKRKNKALKIETDQVGLDVFIPNELTVELLANLDTKQGIETVKMLHTHFTEILNQLVNVEVDNFLKANSVTPQLMPISNSGNITKTDLLKMDYDKRVQFFNNSPERFRAIMEGR